MQYLNITYNVDVQQIIAVNTIRNTLIFSNETSSVSYRFRAIIVLSF